MKLPILLLVCAMIGTAGAQTMTQSSAVDVRQAGEVAGKSLSTLSQLVTEQNFRAMGFESAKEAAGASLGTGEGRLDDVLAAVTAHGPAPRALVLENDYRDGGTTRPLRDLAWARARAGRPAPLLPLPPNEAAV